VPPLAPSTWNRNPCWIVLRSHWHRTGVLVVERRPPIATRPSQGASAHFHLILPKSLEPIRCQAAAAVDPWQAVTVTRALSISVNTRIALQPTTTSRRARPRWRHSLRAGGGNDQKAPNLSAPHRRRQGYDAGGPKAPPQVHARHRAHRPYLGRNASRGRKRVAGAGAQAAAEGGLKTANARRVNAGPVRPSPCGKVRE